MEDRQKALQAEDLASWARAGAGRARNIFRQGHRGSRGDEAAAQHEMTVVMDLSFPTPNARLVEIVDGRPFRGVKGFVCLRTGADQSI